MTYLDFVKKYLNASPDAMLWIMGYGLYVHAIDDLVDKDIPKDKTYAQLLLDTFEFAETIYTNIFYLNNISILRPLIKATSQAYIDSVKWEHSSEEWKRRVSDQLRQYGNEVLLACVEIVSGLEVKRQAATVLREISWKAHHLKDGTPC
jgi:hypothetical protein